MHACLVDSREQEHSLLHEQSIFAKNVYTEQKPYQNFLESEFFFLLLPPSNFVPH